MPEVDAERLPARFGLAALAGAGAVAMVTRSFLYEAAPVIPWGFVPDARPVVVFGVVAGLAAGGAFAQGARTAALWTVVLLALVFELDHSTIHWFSSFPGTLTGARLDPVRTAGALVAVVSVMLLQADAHAERTAREARARGVPEDEAAEARSALVAHARRRALGLGAGGLGAAAVVVVADVAFGDTTLGPGAAGLAAGLAVVALLVVVLLGPVRTRPAE